MAYAGQQPFTPTGTPFGGGGGYGAPIFSNGLGDGAGSSAHGAGMHAAGGPPFGSGGFGGGGGGGGGAAAGSTPKLFARPSAAELPVGGDPWSAFLLPSAAPRAEASATPASRFRPAGGAYGFSAGAGGAPLETPLAAFPSAALDAAARSGGVGFDGQQHHALRGAHRHHLEQQQPLALAAPAPQLAELDLPPILSLSDVVPDRMLVSPPLGGAPRGPSGGAGAADRAPAGGAPGGGGGGGLFAFADRTGAPLSGAYAYEDAASDALRARAADAPLLRTDGAVAADYAGYGCVCPHALVD